MSYAATTRTSCVHFYAYHSTFVASNGYNLNYGVLPFCSKLPEDQMLAIASHELIGTVTNSAVGLIVNRVNQKVGWYSKSSGEVSDLCMRSVSHIQGRDGLTNPVQPVFNRRSGACFGFTQGDTIVTDLLNSTITTSTSITDALQFSGLDS